jgi:hypothetical protein
MGGRWWIIANNGYFLKKDVPIIWFLLNFIVSLQPGIKYIT